MKIRIANSKDIATISNILATSWRFAYRTIVADDYLNLLNNNHWVEFLNTGLGDGSVFAMVLENEYQIIGAAIIGQELHGSTANLLSFYLLPEEIGQGSGHVFYEGIEAELKQKGFAKCVLDVLEKNNRAIRFYEKHGFIDTEETAKAILGDVEYICKVYEKRLS